ncbi:MAG: adenylosuccinate lyase [Microscillaceae bacterium]|nr:adenylosuccinate lyase [Microscillaceae bacterium]
MELNPLTAISPIDGRYRSKVKTLARYFSEMGLIEYRLKVEIEYFITLSSWGLTHLPELENTQQELLRDIYRHFGEKEALYIKEIEKITNHDVKAVEYFLKEKMELFQMDAYKEFVHFGLTSQDINNTAIPWLLKDFFQDEYVPLMRVLIEKIRILAIAWKDIPMLARTHGQPATPTRLGKELMVFVERLEGQALLLQQIPFKAKFGGATGNLNAHFVAYPQVDWVGFADHFVGSLGLERSRFTTQIEHYDHLSALLDGIKRINTILIDLTRDMWQYISMDYFKQKIVSGEIGSSAMPHKVNPIDFENSEGNLGLANALLEFLSAKLPISRLQRDLTDSTVLRNLGVPFAHTIVAIQSLIKGLEKLELNQAQLEKDLHDNWAVVSEAIQTILRRESYPQPYETLKGLTRTHQKIDAENIQEFIRGLPIDEALKAELLAITPFNYIGVDLF